MIVLAARVQEHWVEQASGITYYLDGLDLSPCLRLSFDLLSPWGRPLSTTDSISSRYLEQCLSLVDGNPLALELMMLDFSKRSQTPKEYFERLTSSGTFEIDRTWAFASLDRRIVKHACDLCASCDWSSTPFRDVKFLSPFLEGDPY